MPRYRVEVVHICRNWTEVEVEAESEHAALIEVRDMDLSIEHLDLDPVIEVNVFFAGSEED